MPSSLQRPPLLAGGEEGVPRDGTLRLRFDQTCPPYFANGTAFFKCLP